MPYFYLYDTSLQDRSFTPQLIKLEGLLTDLGIQGRVGRLTLLKSVKDLVETAVRDGADTLVAVGNDITLSRLAGVVAGKSNLTLGFIPLGPGPHELAKILGIPVGLLACQVLSSRMVEDISLGKVGNYYFLQSAILHGQPLLTFDNNYNLHLHSPHTIKICNLDWYHEIGGEISNPLNNTLETILRPLIKSHWWHKFFASPTLAPSLLPVKTLQLKAEVDELILTLDNYQVLKTPATITISPHKIRVIVGKQRLF
jgi:hypothetical protein